MMTGTLLLSGGHEHTRSSTTVDRALLASLERAAPHVVVMPAASSPRKRPAVAMRSQHYWSRMGATVDVVDVDRVATADERAARLRDADLIALTGGHPARLAAATATTWWPHIVGRWRQGAALSGSSAGAMVLCEWRQELTPPRPLRLVRAFGLIVGCAAAPHFNRPVVRRWASAISRAHPGVTLLGLDEGTAIVGRDERYTVHGIGAVTLMRAGVANRYSAGRALPDGLGAYLHSARFPRIWSPVRDPAARRPVITH